MAYSIGLIGNIASGKTTVANLFAAKGIEIISADVIAKTLTAAKGQLFQPLVEHFGVGMLTPEGELNRPLLRELIFENPQERLWLEQLLHPAIRQQIHKAVEASQSPYCLVEIPLLPNRADYPYLNRMLWVYAPPEQQLARLLARDNTSEETAQAMLDAQAQASQHRSIADDIILNHGSLNQLAQQVEQLHQNYLSQSSALPPDQTSVI